MNNPLVSVIIITYNSSQYIVDTLDSVKNQTYENIELIISDDDSTDDTLCICQCWLKKNARYLKKTNLIKAQKNTGVAGNVNRGIRASHGIWIKILAGDDKLFPDSIQEYVNYILQHPDYSIVEALMKIKSSNKTKEKIVMDRYNNIYNQIRNTHSQYRRCLVNCFFPGPTIFFKRDLFNKIGGYDERYQFCEEYPFSLYVLKEVKLIPLIEKELVIYNVNDSSISNGDKVNVRNLKDNINFFREYRSKELLKRFMIFHWLDIASRYNQSEVLTFYPESKIRKILSFLFILFSPITVFKKTKRKIKQLIA